jgi:hypothetical protein
VILLDTNVMSEVMRPAPESTVLEWLNDSDSAQLFLSTVTIAEICYGLSILPEGHRRRDIGARFEDFIGRGFRHRILTFDYQAAVTYGEIMGRRKERGRPMSVLDGQIAAIAKSRGLRIATRNTPDFVDCGLELINPWP